VNTDVLLLAVHALCALLLAGLCLMVGVVHYPLFATVALAGQDTFGQYARQHASRITWVVAPLMFIELATGALLLARAPAQPWWWANAGALALIWLVTFAWSVPMHARLQAGFAPRALASLNRSHALRTTVWLARGVLLLYALAAKASSAPVAPIYPAT
jgi:hypothetical protein